jgi:outer membrane receptor for monomeric catechols
MLNMQIDGPPSNAAIDSEAAKKQSPRHQFNARAQWDISNSVAVDGIIYYVDSVPAYQVPAYWRFDARLGWRLTDTLQLDVVGQNLLDDSRREIGAASDANAIVIGRSVFGRFIWRR